MLKFGKRCDFDTKAIYLGATAMEHAEYRRDFDDTWAEWSFRPRDEKPRAWFAKVKELVDAVVETQRGIVEQDNAIHGISDIDDPTENNEASSEDEEES